ncbi:hypothetical protein GQ54DRAFT_8581 [Martensiomyces pterosporus]|nr:hypothetical protein GQ54DRAFT_8581 [Martensiomyces pterosporus]
MTRKIRAACAANNGPSRGCFFRYTRTSNPPSPLCSWFRAYIYEMQDEGSGEIRPCTSSTLLLSFFLHIQFNLPHSSFAFQENSIFCCSALVCNLYGLTYCSVYKQRFPQARAFDIRVYFVIQVAKSPFFFLYGVMAQPKPPKKFAQSSVFVPPNWNVDNTRAGIVGLITQVCREVDNHYCPSVTSSEDAQHRNFPSNVSVVDDPDAVFDRKKRGSRTLPTGSHASVSGSSVLAICPGCKTKVFTRVKRQTGFKNVAATAALATVGFATGAPPALMPLAAIPMQLKSLKTKVHYCPRCNFKLGKHVRIYIPKS